MERGSPYVGIMSLSEALATSCARSVHVGEASVHSEWVQTPQVSLPPQIHSDSDEGDGAIKYTISGEGAGTIFLIDELTGDIHAMERLDREQKTFYTLRAQARDRATNRLLEPESEFIIKVQDINDSEPRFLHGPYIGSVAELSPTGGRWSPGGKRRFKLFSCLPLGH